MNKYSLLIELAGFDSEISSRIKNGQTTFSSEKFSFLLSYINYMFSYIIIL